MRIVLAVLILALPLRAQTWFTVVSDDQPTTTATLPVGATYRFYAPLHDKAAKPIVQPDTTPVVAYDPGPLDPDEGFPKVFQVLETATAQTITVTIKGVAANITVPALPAPATQDCLVQIVDHATGKVLTTFTINGCTTTGAPK